jgi:hypothetical protein
MPLGSPYLALSEESSDNIFLSHLHIVAHLNTETIGRGKLDASLVERTKKISASIGSVTLVVGHGNRTARSTSHGINDLQRLEVAMSRSYRELRA